MRGYREEAVQVQKKKRRVEAGEKEQWNKSAEALMTEQQGYREERIEDLEYICRRKRREDR